MVERALCDCELGHNEWVRLHMHIMHNGNRPIAVNPSLITTVRPLHPGPGALISFSGDGAIEVVEDFATVMDQLAGKRT